LSVTSASGEESGALAEDVLDVVLVVDQAEGAEVVPCRAGAVEAGGGEPSGLASQDRVGGDSGEEVEACGGGAAASDLGGDVVSGAGGCLDACVGARSR
jgi:hypothetical protein